MKSAELGLKSVELCGRSALNVGADNGECTTGDGDDGLDGNNTLVVFSNISNLAYWSAVVLNRHFFTLYLNRARGVSQIFSSSTGSPDFLSIERKRQ